MALRLTIHILAVAALVVASVVAMADQSDKPIGAHEIPPFVRERVELPPGAASLSSRMARRADTQHRCISVQRQGT